MGASVLAAFLASTSVAQASPCLLVGPSGTSVVIGVSENSLGEIALGNYAGYDWPFVEQFHLPLEPSGDVSQLQPREDGLVPELSRLGQSLNIEIYREGGRHKGVPIFSGSCPSSKSPLLANYVDWLGKRNGMVTPTYDQIVSAVLTESLECQMASAGGWVSRFTLSFDGPNSNFSIKPDDTDIWISERTFEKLGALPLPSPTSVFGMIAFKDASAPNTIGSFNGIWLSASRDRQSRSARIEFYGYMPKGPTSKEWLSGICSSFKNM